MTRGIGDFAEASVVRVHRDDTLRHIANVFAEAGVTWAPVVEREAPEHIVGTVHLADLLQARLHDLTEEHHRERHLGMRRPPRHGITLLRAG
jgi:predicted transcriptional regulator